MYTLGIETSCDETSAAVLKGRDELLSNVISSSLFRHKKFGGVVPEIASRHSLEQMDVVLAEALEEAKVKLKDIDLVAVTKGPGLIGSLFVGVTFAKALAYQLEVPLVGVNHLEAHLSAGFIGQKMPRRFLGLLVSGGHTILTAHEKGNVTVLGATVDDAVGEAYDKVAKMMGLGYPGGPIIDKLAKEGDPKAFSFTKPKQKNPYDFSFSGIKTAVLYTVQKHSSSPQKSKTRLTEKFIRDMAASFQQTVVQWLMDKTFAAAADKQMEDIVIGGGVSANSFLREQMPLEGASRDIQVWLPTRQLALDNAGMIARRGVELFSAGIKDNYHLTGTPNLKIGAH